jgi:hypothetical protein
MTQIMQTWMTASSCSSSGGWVSRGGWAVAAMGGGCWGAAAAVAAVDGASWGHSSGGTGINAGPLIYWSLLSAPSQQVVTLLLLLLLLLLVWV